MKDPKKINIAIVDDTPMRLDGMATNLLKTDKINIVGTALNEKAFLKLCAENEDILDVLIMDKNIERNSQIDDLIFIKEIRDRFPKQKIIIYTWDYNIEHITPFKQIKINGYLPDSVSVNTMIEAIKSVMAGYSYFPEYHISDKSDYDRGNQLDVELLKLVNSLSPGQNKVAELLALDMLNTQIAKKLEITVKAVENHVQKIYHKLLIFPDEEQARSKFNHQFGAYFRQK